MDAVDPGGLGGTFGGNPVSCAAANVVLDAVPAMRERSEALGVRMRSALEEIASRVPVIGEVRGLGPMLALEIVRDRETKTPAPEILASAIGAARSQGLLLLACGLHGNVLRLLPPLTITDEELTRGLEILEACMA
jgi:4-aminobutyrate aminotransferase/(S)-3-amino-2-methylpropionate transaminase